MPNFEFNGLQYYSMTMTTRTVLVSFKLELIMSHVHMVPLALPDPT